MIQLPDEDDEFIAPVPVAGKKIDPDMRKKLRAFL